MTFGLVVICFLSFVVCQFIRKISDFHEKLSEMLQFQSTKTVSCIKAGVQIVWIKTPVYKPLKHSILLGGDLWKKHGKSPFAKFSKPTQSIQPRKKQHIENKRNQERFTARLVHNILSGREYCATGSSAGAYSPAEVSMGIDAGFRYR